MIPPPGFAGRGYTIWRKPPGWRASFGPWKNAHTDTLDEALKWCNNEAGNGEIMSAEGAATRQEERFAWWPPGNGG